MDSSPENPKGNALGPGISEAKLAAAVRRSGYPLQTLVARDLREEFRVEEEWSFIDDDTKTLRSLDIRANKDLFDWKEWAGTRIRPHLTLLIECKQSDMPYVFFLSPNDAWLRQFPSIDGLFSTRIEVLTDDDSSSWSFSITDALKLRKDPFVTGPAEVCRSLSKAVRKGADLELSGTEPFQGLILPLVKALRYHSVQVTPPKTAHYFDAHLAVAIAVVDAPMVGVRIDDADQALVSVPWVRVLRHEAVEADHKFDREQLYAVDVVHREFLSTYLNDHLKPFAQKFGAEALAHAEELATGQAFIEGLGASGSHNAGLLQPRPQPKF